jgi:sugar phosphate isomerase/epimerase
MFTLSAFADEISPDPREQIAVLRSCGVRHIEFRSILKTNVLALSDLQIREFQSLLGANGFRLSAIGSPIGKIRIDEPFGPHLEKFKRAVELCGIFGTPNIRVFSYYPPEQFDGDWSPWRDEVFRRTAACLEVAEPAGLRLLHENEHRIYGDSPERVRDLASHFAGPAFTAVYDPANYVHCGFDPIDGWERTKEFTGHFHIKDWKRGAEHGSLAGEGDGQVERVMADAVARGYDGFATLEPHLLSGGPTGGVTGPELFPKAVEAFRGILRRVGGRERTD